MDSHDPRTWHWAYGAPESLMSTKTLSIRHNKDNTITISAGNQRESIEVTGKTDPELMEAVRYAVICQDFEWTPAIEELVRTELKKGK